MGSKSKGMHCDGISIMKEKVDSDFELSLSRVGLRNDKLFHCSPHTELLM